MSANDWAMMAFTFLGMTAVSTMTILAGEIIPVLAGCATIVTYSIALYKVRHPKNTTDSY